MRAVRQTACFLTIYQAPFRRSYISCVSTVCPFAPLLWKHADICYSRNAVSNCHIGLVENKSDRIRQFMPCGG